MSVVGVAVGGVEVEVLVLGVGVAVVGVVVEVVVVGVEVSVAVVGVEVEVVVVGVDVACDEPVEPAVVGVEVAVDGVGVAVAGVVVAKPGVEVVVTGVVVDVTVVEVVVDVVVVVVGVMAGDVEVACPELVEVTAGSKTASSEISGMIVEPRCLLSHSATAVTPSCQESYVRVLPPSSLPTLPGLRVLTATPTVPKRESCSMMAIMSRTSTS